MAVEMQPVQSSDVLEVGWDEAAQELLVRFKDKNGNPGSLYAYPSAGQGAYQDLLEATSPGQYVARWLRSQPHRKII